MNQMTGSDGLISSASELAPIDEDVFPQVFPQLPNVVKGTQNWELYNALNALRCVALTLQRRKREIPWTNDARQQFSTLGDILNRVDRALKASEKIQAARDQVLKDILNRDLIQ